MTPDLLPPNAAPQERALSLAIARAAGLPAPLRALWRPDTCPASLLPWLAWSLAVEPWDSAWTEMQKRAAIAASVEVHRRKGTIGAIKTAIRALGHNAVVEEGAPGSFTFSISLVAGADGISSAVMAEARTIALRTKNARSHLSATVTRLDIAPDSCAVAGTLLAQRLVVAAS